MPISKSKNLTRLTKKKIYRRLSDICVSVAQVSLATVAVPFFILQSNWLAGIPGVLTTLIFWTFSILISFEEAKYE